MEQDLRRLMLDPHLLPIEKRNLLSDIAAQAADLNMPCYLVGGFARDLFLQKPSHDFDIVVEGNAIQLGKALVRQRGGKLTLHPTFRTAVWLPPFENFPALDLITARAETYERPGALPTIRPSTLADDLRRRDFTINAMATRLDGEHFGEVIDPLDGRSDLAQGRIRVLHPRSFIDDPTRIFRAARYEQRYGFKIESDTLNLINSESLEILSNLSGERIRHEFDLVFEEKNAALILSRLDELGVFNALHLPKFNAAYAGLLGFEPPAEFDISIHRVLLAYLFWLMDSPARVIAQISKRLDFNAELRAAALTVSQLKTDLPAFKDSKPSQWTARLEKVPPSAVCALWLATGETALKKFLVKWRRMKSNITGGDLKARGLPPSPRYREILSQLRAAWLDGEIKNGKEEKELLAALLSTLASSK